MLFRRHPTPPTARRRVTTVPAGLTVRGHDSDTVAQAWRALQIWPESSSRHVAALVGVSRKEGRRLRAAVRAAAREVGR